MAIAGALATVPQAAHAQAATARPAATAAAADHLTALDTVAVKAVTGDAHYKVRSGDTLSKIAGRYYGKTSDWQWLYHQNEKRISDPDTIYPGQELSVPADPPANYTLPDYQPRHARSAVTANGTSDSHRTAAAASGTSDGHRAVIAQSASTGASTAGAKGGTASASSHASASSARGSTSLSGTLGCSGLEHLWEDAGGNPSDAHMAAEIAMAESGGNQFAVSPTSDYGYWQINASNGALATFNPYGNARAAVVLSGNGSNWSPWTTYTSGAYAGRC